MSTAPSRPQLVRKMNELAWTKLIWLFLLRQFPGGGVMIGRERQIWDKTRVDLLTADLALEVDWAHKWAEAFGQSDWYAFNFRRKRGVCILSEDFKADANYIYKAQVICALRGVEFWLVDCQKREIIINGDTHPLDPPEEA